MVLLPPHLPPISPARARLPWKVSLGLRAPYPSSEPAGATRCRTLFISSSEGTVRQEVGSGAAWGWALPSEAPSRALRCPVSPGWPGLDLQKGCVSYLKVRVALGKAGQEDQAVLLLSQQGWVLGGRHSPIPPAPFLCVDCLCYPHRSMAITSSSSSRKWGSLRPAPGVFLSGSPFPSVSAAETLPSRSLSLAAAFLLLCLPGGWGLAF